MYQRILVPVDGSATSVRGLEEAIRLATLTHGRLRLIHVIDELSFALGMDAYAGYAGDWLKSLRDNGNALLKESCATAAAAGVEADFVLHHDFSAKVPDAVMAEAASWQADLIVLGTHGRRGIGRMVMGSGAENILRCATVPVLLVRAPEQVAAVEGVKTSVRVSLPSAALAFE